MLSPKSVIGLSLCFALSLSACSNRGAVGPGVNPSGPVGDPGATPMRTVIVNQDTAPQSYPLEGGRYRVAWTSTLAECPDGLVIAINKVDVLPANPNPSPFAYENAPNAPAFNTLIQRTPPGLYTIEQTEASCTTWEIRADRVGN
jgi:hypothetical protein